MTAGAQKSRPAKATALDSEASDEELLQQIAGGNRDALGVLFDRHAASVHQLALRVAPRGDADDIVQDTFIRVAKIAAAYQPSTTSRRLVPRSAPGHAHSARVWIIGIAYSVTRERRRSLARLLRALSNFGSIESQRMVSPPEATRTEIEKHLEALSPDRREVLVLTEILGMTGPEAAQVLGVPVGTVWTRLHQARRTLIERARRNDV